MQRITLTSMFGIGRVVQCTPKAGTRASYRALAGPDNQSTPCSPSYSRSMISAFTGQLQRVGEDRAWLSAGPGGVIDIEVLVPASDVPDLERRIGETLTFHTVFYIEGDASGGNLTPRLIGFTREIDRGFFNAFITVKGIGPKKALKALAIPASEIAAAIENGDSRALMRLPQIGKRAADTIIAELGGKVGRFVEAGIATSTGAGRRPAGGMKLDSQAEDAVATLVALGERRADAEALLIRLREQSEPPTTTDALVREMLRLRSGPR